MVSDNIPDVYLLRLANGQTWQLVASAEAAQWLDHFAQVMRLPRAARNGEPVILFSCGFPPGESREKWTLAYANIDFSIYRSETSPVIICDVGMISQDERSYYVKMLYALYPFFTGIIGSGGFPFHAALLERDGHGVLIAAEGGTGKSTCCRRVPPPWKALCDDETLLCLYGNHYEAHPFPTWSDYVEGRDRKTWDVQGHVKVDAIFFLRQDTQDRVVPIQGVKAAMLLYESAVQASNRIYIIRDGKKYLEMYSNVFNNTCEASKIVPCYELYASLDGKFWELIDAVLPK